MLHSSSTSGDRGGSWSHGAQQDSVGPSPKRQRLDQVAGQGRQGTSAVAASVLGSMRSLPAASHDSAAAGPSASPHQASQPHRLGHTGVTEQQPLPRPPRRKLPAINRGAGSNPAAFHQGPAHHDIAAGAAAAAGGALGAPSYASDPAVQRMLLEMQRQLQASDVQKRRRKRKAKPRAAPASEGAAATADGPRHHAERQPKPRVPPTRHTSSSSSGGSGEGDVGIGAGAGGDASGTPHAGRTSVGTTQPQPTSAALLQRLQRPAALQPPPPGFQQQLPPDLRGSAHALEWAAAISDYRRRKADGLVAGAAAVPGAPAAAAGAASAAAAAQTPARAAAQAADRWRAASDPSGALGSIMQQWRASRPPQPASAPAGAGGAQHVQPVYPSSALLAAAISGAQFPALQPQLQPPVPPALAGAAAGSAAPGGLMQQHQAALAAAASAAAAAVAQQQQQQHLTLAAVLASASSNAVVPAAQLCDSLQRLSSHQSGSSSGSWQRQAGRDSADHTPTHPAARADPALGLAWRAKRLRTSSRQQHEPASPAPCPLEGVPGSRKQLAAAGGWAAGRPFVWREPRPLGKRGWARLLRASLVALPLRQLLDLVVWQPRAAMASTLWWARRLGSLALLTSFPCPAAVPPGLAVGILTLAEFSLRVAPGRLWD